MPEHPRPGAPRGPREARGFVAELPEQGEPPIGSELIRVRYFDGRVEELRLHDYERLYALPGVYEEIVTERLGCRSPEEIAALLATAVDRVGWDRRRVRVVDLAAGNGISGAALAAEGLRPVLGADIVETARTAVLRDRPGVYDDYLTLDALAMSEAQRRAVAAWRACALCCVAPVGSATSQVPAAAVVAVARLLAPDALVAYMHDPGTGEEDPVSEKLWRSELGAGTAAEELTRRRYVHRFTVGGRPYEMDGVVWRVRRPVLAAGASQAQ